MDTTVAPNLEWSPHWSNTEARNTFSQVVADLGLNGASVPAVLGVDRVSDYEGTVEDAIDVLTEYAQKSREDIRDTLNPQQAQHAEAQAIAFTEVYTEDGTRINITARQGAAPDDIVATVLALTDAVQTLKKFGFRTTRPSPHRPQPKTVAPGATEFWAAAYKHIGPGKAFENKSTATNWLQQFATGKGHNWTEAIKALASVG